MSKKLLASIFLAVALAFAARVAIQEVVKLTELKVEDVRVLGIGAKGVTLEVQVKVKNHLNTTAILEGIEYDLYVGSYHIGHGYSSDRLELPPRAYGTARTTLDLTYMGVIRAVISAARGGKVSIRGKAYLITEYGRVVLPLAAVTSLNYRTCLSVSISC